ncbi:MAG: hypothetical protein ACXVY8_02510 [Gaiellaceae bacterium]
MQLRLNDSIYTERLASFLSSLGQATIVSGPEEIELLTPEDEKSCEIARREVEIYLRVWRVLYPDADAELVDGDEPVATYERALSA